MDTIDAHPAKGPLIKKIKAKLLSPLAKRGADPNMRVKFLAQPTLSRKDSELSAHAEVCNESVFIPLKGEPQELSSPPHALAAKASEKVERSNRILRYCARVKAFDRENLCAGKMLLETSAYALYFR
jgi:hypothetical protein